MITITNLHKSFENNHVLQGVDLEIGSGDSIAIIGKSGCGKSVLLKHIVGLLQPDKGLVKIDGKNLADLKSKELYQLRRRFGFLFQGAALFDSMTVGENMSLPIIENGIKMSQQKLDYIISEKLDLVGLKGIENQKPAELSGGMRKRVGLARALISDPDFILYDEPTTGLDPISSDVIDELIKNLKENLNVTSIIVTHDMYTVNTVVDHVAMMNEGKIYFNGTPDVLNKSDDKNIKEFIKRTE